MNRTRRNFIKSIPLGLASMGVLSQSQLLDAAPGVGAASNIGNANPEILRVGFIGVGGRSHEHLKNVLLMGKTDITSICDIQKSSIDKALVTIDKYSITPRKPVIYTGSNYSFKEMLDKEKFDAVIICTPWEWHTPMAVYAMNAGVKYVGVEVSAANTIEECWDLVNTSESTGSQLCILENVCYRHDIMACLNMVRQNIFGELLHAQCGYEHDLRYGKFNVSPNSDQAYRPLKMGPEAQGEAQWRTNHSIHRNGDLYPTHGLGPVALIMDINRGNRFLTISSMATKSRGLNKLIVDYAGKDHPYAKINFNCGDIVTSMIKCANGETIIVVHDTNSPRPYSLGFRVQGTQGLWMNDGNNVYIEGISDYDKWDEASEWFDKYEHSMWKNLRAASSGAGHGGMDYIMMYDFIHAVRNNLSVPMDCYDAASWSAVSQLSEMSIARGGTAVDFPDFTRGQWINRKNTFAL